MDELDLKNRIGIFLIVSQFVLVIIVFISYLLKGYDYDEMTTTIALMFPMLSVYTTAMVKFFISNRTGQPSQQQIVSKQFVFIAGFFPILFVSGLLLIIILKPLNKFDNFEQFKGTLAMIESLFGGFTGYIMSALLEKS